MACSTCKCTKKPCGCEDAPLTTGSPCAQDTPECPNPNPCAETFSSDCIIFTGDSILDTGFNYGDNLTVLMQKLSIWLTNPNCINPAFSCKSPVNFRTTNITTTTIKLAWDAVASATLYIVEYKLSTSNTWTLNAPLTPVANPTDTIGGLTSNTTYDIRVSATCPSGTCYSVTIQVKTI